MLLTFANFENKFKKMVQIHVEFCILWEIDGKSVKCIWVDYKKISILKNLDSTLRELSLGPSSI